MKKSDNHQASSSDGVELAYADAGSGKVVFVLQSGTGTLADGLTDGHRVIAFNLGDSRDRQSIAQSLRRTANQLAIGKYSLVAQSESAPAAIALAIENSDSVDSLVLVSPNDVSSSPALEQINTPTLVLVGTRDRAATIEGRVCARRIPKCFYTLVYDAGPEIGSDRPQALYAVMREFLERRETFVIAQDSSVINP